MKKKRKKLIGGGDEENEEMTLQITSMADIFTILLVFLLKSAASGMSTITPTTTMTLPSVQTDLQGQIKETLVLEIASDAVIVDQKAVSDLRQFHPSDEKELGDNVLRALLSERKKEQTNRAPASLTGEEPVAESKLLVLSDELTPYSTLKTIMNSAAAAGYVDLQLVVTKPD